MLDMLNSPLLSMVFYMALAQFMLVGVLMLLSFLVGFWLGGRKYRKRMDAPRPDKFIRSLDTPRL